MLGVNYTLLIGDEESGLKNFIEHQSNIQTLEGKAVVLKRYQATSSDKQQILKKIKETRFYMELALGLDRQARTQIFFINDRDVPYDEIRFIKQKYPEDHIILVSESVLKVEGFKTIHFPPVRLQQIKWVIMDYYQMSSGQARKTIRQHGGSVQKIFDYFKRKAKRQDYVVEQFIEVDDIQELNQLSQKLARKKALRALQLHKREKQIKKGKRQEGGKKKKTQRKTKRDEDL